MSTPLDELTTGWDRLVPVEDTLLRRYLYHHATVGEAVAVAGGGRALATDELVATDLGRPAGYWNSAVLVRPPSDWAEVLDEVDAFFSRGTGEVLLWSAWPTPDLRAHGWHLAGHPPLLIRPPATMAALPAAPPLDVRRVTTTAELAAWERVAIEGYPLPELQPFVPGRLAGPSLLDDERLDLWLGYDHDQPVAAAASFVAHGLSSLAFGATRAVARRRGFWQALAIRRLATHPELWASGVFSDHSRPGAEALGFLPVLRLTLWVRER